MNSTPDNRPEPLWRRMVRGWNNFWFTPADPTMLGLMRILCGAITLYTMVAYTFSLQEFMGPDGWYNLDLRLEVVREKPWTVSSLSGQEYPPLPPARDADEKAELKEYYDRYKMDLRIFGLPMPRTPAQRYYLYEYSEKWKFPPPAYVKSPEEKKAIDDYMMRQGGLDPRRAYAIGSPFWSIWFHVTDPTWMMVIHGGVIIVTFLFMIGFCTRITSVLTWMMALWYIHRNFVVLFGVDTMMVILLLYLCIGPSGAAYSVDRLIARWWSKAKPRVINRWRGLFGKPALPESQIQPAAYSLNPVPAVSANVALRLLQIHLCIIYLIAGLTKLQGPAWWNGTAVWGTLANFEFAPMQFAIYNTLLRWLGSHQLLFEFAMTGAGMFTLAFEITFAFLIWRPATRWVLLWGAIILHGFIGMLMGLKTFSLMMLVFNMAFIRPDEVHRFFGLFNRFFAGPASMPKPRKLDKPEPVGSLAPAAEMSPGSTGIQQKR